MESVLKSDIFFFITSFVVILLGVAGLVIAAQIYRVLKEIERIAKNTSQATEWILEDFDEMREAIREKGLRLRFFLNFFKGLFERNSRATRSSKRRATRVEDEDDGLED